MIESVDSSGVNSAPPGGIDTFSTEGEAEHSDGVVGVDPESDHWRDIFSTDGEADGIDGVAGGDRNPPLRPLDTRSTNADRSSSGPWKLYFLETFPSQNTVMATCEG